MTDTSSLVKGGEHGPILVSGVPDSSRMIKYILLPIDDDLHMAPKGKAQLTDEEIEILKEWVSSGASFSKKLNEYNTRDTFRSLAQSYINKRKTDDTKIYALESLDEKEVQSLNNDYRSVKPLNFGSPALIVKYTLPSKFTSQSLEELKPIADNIIELNLSDATLVNSDLVKISKFKSLEKLIINGTNVDIIQTLSGLTNLKTLSIMNTKIDHKSVQYLAKLKSLKYLFVQGSGLTSKDITTLKNLNKNLDIVTGKTIDEYIQLTSPSVANKSTIIGSEGLTLKHPIKDVAIHYTTDGSQADSTSPVYNSSLSINQPTRISAVAYAKGWLASSPLEVSVLPLGTIPNKVVLDKDTNPKYPGRDHNVVIDSKRASPTNSLDMGWLAFRDETFAGTFTFDAPKSIKKVVVSYSNNLYMWIFPPMSIEVLGGDDPTRLVSIGKINYATPKIDDDTRNSFKTIDLKGDSYKYYKVICQNLKKIPQWHDGKGTPGWLFLDEVFFYE
jgi:hypothetical protein